MPACATTNFAACFNPLAEYGYGVLDVPHRVIIAPIWQLPFGKDRPVGDQWARQRAGRRLDDVGGRQPAERLPDRLRCRATTRCSPGRTGRTSPAPVSKRRETSPTGSRRPIIRPRRGSTRRRSSAAPAGTFGNAPRLITDVAHAADQEHRPVGVQEHRVERRQVGADQGRGHQPVQPRADQQHQRDMRATPRSGRSASQSGFMRLTQVMFRFTF